MKRWGSAVVRHAGRTRPGELLPGMRVEDVFTPAERVRSAGPTLEHWAGRLAGKRAVLKLLGLPATARHLSGVEILPQPTTECRADAACLDGHPPAVRLRGAGREDFVILEKGDTLGGTWRDNTYPGCACDVQSHLYSFSFAPNPDWTRTFARQPEIRAYLERVADRFGVRDRIRYGAKLSQELDLPILVTGGSAFGDGIPVARLMAQALDSSFQVPARWVEDRSRDTHENALLSAQQLRAAGIDTIVLVTHDYHQRRSIAEFEAVGLRVIPAPVTFAPPQRSRNLPEHLPSASALKTSSLALHEIIGYWVLAPKRS